MTGAPYPPTYTNPTIAPPVTGRSFGKIGATFLLLGVAVVAGMFVLARPQAKVAATTGEKPATSPWKAQQIYAPIEEKPAAVTPPATDDAEALRLAQLERKMDGLLMALEEMKKRKPAPTATTHHTPAPKPERPVRHGEPLYIANKIEQGTAPTDKPTYVLAPGDTKIPCQIESVLNSDVPGHFTAKVSTNVYDTATRKHLLVPQGSTILGKDHSEKLLFGNERIPTTSLTLTLPDGRSVDLGQAPITDHQGTTGLGGDVNNHWWRLVGAVFVGGALRGGTQALQSAAIGAAGVDTVITGIGNSGGQAISQQMSRAMDTRPTITVHAGQGCHVLLVKPLSLPAMWR